MVNVDRPTPNTWCEQDPETGLPTGDWVAKHVVSIITKHEGLADGYVLMGLVPA